MACRDGRLPDGLKKAVGDGLDAELPDDDLELDVDVLDKRRNEVGSASCVSTIRLKD